MKRFLAILCSFSMMFTSISVFADNPTVTEIIESGSAEIGIGAEVPSVWKVTLPAKVNLVKQEDDTYKGTFDKIVSGDISSDKKLRVRPVSTSIVISDTNGGKSDVTGSLTDGKTDFLYTDLSDTGRECYVTSPILSAGNWEGIVSYNIDIMGSDYMDPGFYLTDGSLLRTLSVEEVNNYGASPRFQKSLPSYLGLTDDEINTITKIVVPEMEAPANCSYMFYKCQYVEEIDVSGFDTKNVTNMFCMFSNVGKNATTFNLDLSNWKTSNVTNMQQMFSNAGRNATTWSIGDISNWNTKNVTDMGWMFMSVGYNTTTFNLDLSNWNTENVTNMDSMFYEAGRNATTWNIGDLSNWNTKNVTDMAQMFCDAGEHAKIFNIGDLSNWNTENVTDMRNMFAHAGYKATTTFNIGDLSNWNTSKVTNMNYMFSSAGCEATYSLNLSGWNVDKVTSYDLFNSNVESKVTPPVWVN